MSQQRHMKRKRGIAGWYIVTDGDKYTGVYDVAGFEGFSSRKPKAEGGSHEHTDTFTKDPHL